MNVMPKQNNTMNTGVPPIDNSPAPNMGGMTNDMHNAHPVQNQPGDMYTRQNPTMPPPGDKDPRENS